MQISTRGRYGLRAMFELAQGFGHTPVLMSTVAERQSLPPKYLHALLTRLKTAGLVRSMRGSGGGFVLTRPPAEIRLREILCALEGPLSLVACIADKRACNRANRCPARRVWQDIADAVDDALENVTLQDLLAPEKTKCSRNSRNGKRATPRRNGRRRRSPGTAPKTTRANPAAPDLTTRRDRPGRPKTSKR
jgi:Rrf2 family cysteine metabolism transcriptional repressor